MEGAKGNKLIPVLVVVLVAAAFFIGNLSAKVAFLEKGGGVKNTAAGGADAAAAQPQQPAAPKVTLDQVKQLFKGDRIKFGDEKKKLLFVEVADPSCPYCHVAAGKNPALNKQVGDKFTLVSDGGSYVAPVPEMKKLVDEGKAAMVWIYSPGHGNGEMGTRALYCAQEKGKFWQAHDLLMSDAGYTLLNEKVKNDKAKSGEVAEFLKSVVDSGQMKSCIDSGKYDSRLTDEPQLASTFGINGTPGFIINDQVFPGAYSYTDMKSTIEGILK